MKVAVITRHAVTNYGSLLQTIATQQVIKNLGYTCEVIDYINREESYLEHEKTLLKRKNSWNNNPIKKIIYLAIRQPECILSGIRFEKERKKYLNLTKRYTTKDELDSDAPIADLYMTGSDQVWGQSENGSYDSSYCLSFTQKRKIAYAASFGNMAISNELKKYFKDLLSKYEYITVREEGAVDFLGKLGIKAKQVLDPTLLLDENYWKQYMMPIKYKKYILVYQLHNNKKLGEYAQKVAKKKGMQLVRISPSYHQITREGKFVWCTNIGEFLSYIKNAECMITDSFHGTAFAINFNVPFVEVLPNNNTEVRNQSILKLTGLTNRILYDENNINLASEPIDFKLVNEKISEERTKSICLLRRMIES